MALTAVAAVLIGFMLTHSHHRPQVIAEVNEDERWIDDTLELLNAVDEVPADLTHDSLPTDDWWQELQELDEAEWLLGNA